MSATLSIGGTFYTFVESNDGDDNGVDQTNTIDERQRLQVDVLDYSGVAHFVKGESVVLTDPVLGVLFRGVINTIKEVVKYPDATIRHSIDCIDEGRWITDKRTFTREYTTSTYAGKIVVDQLSGVLASEGIAQNYATKYDTTTADFNQGILAGTIGRNSIDDGDLELTPAGSDVIFTETTTTDFAAGTLTNVVAANNSLSPTTQNALKFSVVLPIGTVASSTTASFIYVKIWTGSMTVGVSDTLNYDVWVDGTSPEKIGNINLLFSDLTYSSGSPIYDQNGIPAYSGSDLSNYANNQWYTRQIGLGIFSGKTIIAAMAAVAGHSVGTYTWYVKNCYLGSQSGNKFFSTTSTTTQLNPTQLYQFATYIASTFTTSIVTTFNPATSNRVSTAYSIDAVKLLKSSYITWTASNNLAMYISYTAGASWIACTNNTAIPGMPVGSNVTGLSFQLQEVFAAINDPTIIPVLNDVTVALTSSPAATKSDIVTSFITQANWNTGTFVATQADSSGNLELAPFTRNWNDNLKTGQTAFFPTGTTDSASGGIYTISTPTNAGGVPDLNGFGTSRLDFLGTMLDFTIDCDMKTSSTINEAGITYRQIQWNSTYNNTFGYLFSFTPGSPGDIQMGYGSNSTSDTYIQIALAHATMSTNTFYHFKIVVNGSHHQVYYNNATTPIIDLVDTTYTQAGGIGLRNYNSDGSAAHTSSWDNLVLAQNPAGTWTSTATSISSLGTCGGSVITWTESGTSNPVFSYAFIQSSIDGGSTWQQCTNNQPIPNLLTGASLAGISVQVRVLLGTQNNTMPIVTDLVWRVLGPYPGSSGTRSTIPLGNDPMTRSNVVGGWGTAFDSQSYTKVGAGTVNLNSNKGQIVNTTGDVHMVLGSRTWTDEEGTCRFSLSLSTISGGIELRYVDANNFYRLSASTTALSIIKCQAGSLVTVATTAVTLTTGLLYRMRFRVTGNGPVLFYGRVWSDLTLEPTNWGITGSA